MAAGGDELPTFLFTDVEGSTGCGRPRPPRCATTWPTTTGSWPRSSATTAAVFKFRGDGVAAVFDRPTDGVAAAVAAQRSLGSRALAGRAAAGADGPPQRRGPAARRRLVRAHGQPHRPPPRRRPRRPDRGERRDRRARGRPPPARHHAPRPRRAPPPRPRGARAHPPGRGPRPRRPVLAAAHRAPPEPRRARAGRPPARPRRRAPPPRTSSCRPTGPSRSPARPAAARAASPSSSPATTATSGPAGCGSARSRPSPPGASGADGVASRLADLLGSAVTDGGTPLDAVVGALSERRALVVLDGCDHVLADAAVVAAALRDRCPQTAVLVTSRERLGIADEHLLDLPTLADDDAVALFVERATRRAAGLRRRRARRRRAVAHRPPRRAARWPSSWPPPASAPTSPPRSTGCCRSRSGCCAARDAGSRRAGGDEPPATSRRPSPGPTTCSTRSSSGRSGTSASSPAPSPRPTSPPACPTLDAEECTDLLDGLVERSLVALAPPRSSDRTSRYRLLTTLRSYARRRLDDDPDGRRRVGPRTRSSSSTRCGRGGGPPVRARRGALGPGARRPVGGRAGRRRAGPSTTATSATVTAARRRRSCTTPRCAASRSASGRTTRPRLPGFWDQPEATTVAGLAAEIRIRRADFDGARRISAAAVDHAGADHPATWLAHSTLGMAAFAAGDLDGGRAEHAQMRETGRGPGRDVDPFAPAVAAYMTATVRSYGGADPGGAAAGRPDRRTWPGRPGARRSRRWPAWPKAGRSSTSDPTAARAPLQRALDLAIGVDNRVLAAQTRWALAEVATADDPEGALRSSRACCTSMQAGAGRRPRASRRCCAASVRCCRSAPSGPRCSPPPRSTPRPGTTRCCTASPVSAWPAEPTPPAWEAADAGPPRCSASPVSSQRSPPRSTPSWRADPPPHPFSQRSGHSLWRRHREFG